MEEIVFKYKFNYDNYPKKQIIITCDGDEDGELNTHKICESFVDFMVSAGFSEDSIYDYFKE